VLYEIAFQKSAHPLARLPQTLLAAAALAPALASLATAADPMLRLAAVEAGVGGLDFRTMLTTETMSALRRASAAALARESGTAAPADLVAALRDEDPWLEEELLA
jgi:hypothetical protein